MTHAVKNVATSSLGGQVVFEQILEVVRAAEGARSRVRVMEERW